MSEPRSGGIPKSAGPTTTAEMPVACPPPSVSADGQLYPPPPPPAGAASVLPPGPGVAVAPGPTAAGTPVLTGSGRRISYGPRAQAALTGTCLVLLSVLLLVLGGTLGFGSASLWSAIPLWSLFALVASLLGLLAFVPDAPGRGRLRPHTGWTIAVGGLVGLAVFWVLVVSPGVATDRGFILTAALACLAAALWIAPSRKG